MDRLKWLTLYIFIYLFYIRLYSSFLSAQATHCGRNHRRDCCRGFELNLVFVEVINERARERMFAGRKQPTKHNP